MKRKSRLLLAKSGFSDPKTMGTSVRKFFENKGSWLIAIGLPAAMAFGVTYCLFYQPPHDKNLEHDLASVNLHYRGDMLDPNGTKPYSTFASDACNLGDGHLEKLQSVERATYYPGGYNPAFNPPPAGVRLRTIDVSSNWATVFLATCHQDGRTAYLVLQHQAEPDQYEKICALDADRNCAAFIYLSGEGPPIEPVNVLLSDVQARRILKGLTDENTKNTMIGVNVDANIVAFAQ